MIADRIIKPTSAFLIMLLRACSVFNRRSILRRGGAPRRRLDGSAPDGLNVDCGSVGGSSTACDSGQAFDFEAMAHDPDAPSFFRRV
jgi:hypothetical protein